MLRLLFALWLLAAVLVAVLRHRAGGLSTEKLRGDLAAAFFLGMFAFVVIAVAR